MNQSYVIMSDKSTTKTKIIMKKFNRDIRRTIRLTKDEDEHLTELFEYAGRTRSEWVRDKIRNSRHSRNRKMRVK